MTDSIERKIAVIFAIDLTPMARRKSAIKEKASRKGQA